MEEWGPEIKHDGARPVIPNRCRVLATFDTDSKGKLPDENQPLTYNSPNWFWRWKTINAGIFGKAKIRVCDDPAYAPIIAYRIRRPRGVAILADIAANPDAPLPCDAPARETEQARA